MRCTLYALVFFCAGGLPVLHAQSDSPQARALRAQLEEVQRQLDDLARRESSTQKVTEIGSSRVPARQDEEPRMVVRIYDLGDLYSVAPAYFAREPEDLMAGARHVFPQADLAASGVGGMGGQGFGGGGMGGFFSVPSAENRAPVDPFREPRAAMLHQIGGGSAVEGTAGFRTSVDSLIDTITSTISPDQWDEVGGPATITALGASLIVSAPADMHDKIAALIDLFRKRWGSLRTVSIEAHWLWLTEDQLAASGRQPNAPPPAFGVLSDAAWTQLREQSRAHAAKRIGYHAVLTCYNGQTVSTLAGRQHLIVSGMTPVVGGGETEAAYHPETRVVLDAAALQVTPIATRTAKFVVVDVHSRVNLLDAKLPAAENPEQPAAAPAGVAPLVASLDRPALESQRLATTLRIPVDRPTLVGGMTFAAPGAEDPNLYLFLTAHVQELRDDEAAETDLEPADVPSEPDVKPAKEPPAAPASESPAPRP